jgi:hypothetical protein
MPEFMPKFVDLVRNYTTVEGTGAVSPGAAVGGFTGFGDAVTTGEQFYYCIQGIDKPAEREVGRGTLLANGNIAREPIEGAPVNFTAGMKTVALVAAAEWFSKIEQRSGGAVSAHSFGAKGDGETDDHSALQAWLDHGGALFLPEGHYYSSQTLVVRRHVDVSGAGFGFDGRIYGYEQMPGSRIRFPIGVAGIDVQPQTEITDIATVLADPDAAFTQEGAHGAIFRDFALIGGNDGPVADGFHARTLVHCENVQSIWFMGDGFHLSATSDMPNADDEYGNASGSTLTNCVAIANAGNGFRLRGRDVNACVLTGCNARTNALWGILDESLLGNTYVQPHLARNFSGAIKAVGAVATSSFVQPYIEGDINANCAIGGSNVVIGPNIDAINAPPDVAPANVSGHTTSLNKLRFTWGWPGQGAVAGEAHAYRSVLGGLTLQGEGGDNDFTLLNRAGSAVLRVPTGSANLRVEGAISADGITTRNGFILRADSNAVMYAPVGGDTYFYSPSSGAFRFNNLANSPHTSVDNDGNWTFLGGIALGPGKSISAGGVHVLGARKTGWATASGTATRTAFDTASVTLPQLAERVKALIDDLHGSAGHGLIGS